MDITADVVQRQLSAMDIQVFEIGIYTPANDLLNQSPRMQMRDWKQQDIMDSLPWLKHRNSIGDHIYCRPWGQHHLSLVDDLSADSIKRMNSMGFEPAVVLETSPGNYQAWLNHGTVLSNDVSTAVARQLAKDFSADENAADWRHFGRLAGFTNRKAKYRDDDTGYHPWVKLKEATGRVYDRAETFVWSVSKQLEHERAAAARNRTLHSIRHPNDKPRSVKTIDQFRNDSRYEQDGNRIDFAYAIYAFSRGLSEHEVASAIGTRDLTKKGGAIQQEAYIRRTLHKALQISQQRGR